MSTSNQIMTDIAKLSEDAKLFVGDFLYAPFGIESSDTVNAITLYVLLGAASYVLYRISREEPRVRAKLRRSEYSATRR